MKYQQKQQDSSWERKINMSLLSLFTGDIILYVENFKEFTTKLLKLIKELSKDTRSIYRNQMYFYTLARNSPKMKLRKQL